MSAMDHAAAHERIEYLILEPARMRGLAASSDAEDVALREHVDSCRVCRDDLEAWGRLQRRVAAALPSSADEAAGAVEPIEVPPSLRAAVIVAARAAGDAERTLPAPTRTETARRRRPVGAWLALAASFVVLAGATAITVDQVNRRAVAEAEAQALSAALAAVDRVLAVPEPRIRELRTTTGEPAGSISWSRHDWVVLTTALHAPPPDQRYRCWLEDGGTSVAVGEMEFVGDTAFWVASIDAWVTWEIGPTTQFVVTLEPADAQARTGAAVLSADLAAS
jgi:hypothetical protein